VNTKVKFAQRGGYIVSRTRGINKTEARQVFATFAPKWRNTEHRLKLIHRVVLRVNRSVFRVNRSLLRVNRSLLWVNGSMLGVNEIKVNEISAQSEWMSAQSEW